MPDPSAPDSAPLPGPQDAAVLTRLVVQAVTAVPGVIRLEPTLRARAGRLGAALLSRPAAAGGQGVSIELLGSTARVEMDIAVTAQRPLAQTVREVQAVTILALRQHHLRCTQVSVSVLTLHP